ncbi:hypothetical protein [Kallipyga gabonensis]|uniref:hypothetical protein n=1 Tax=Kallipyga gabonensis TaxID=1686287 RepID=UPI0006B5B523|nr:hypothetical protein [Kallipyga gabonensis]
MDQNAALDIQKMNWPTREILLENENLVVRLLPEVGFKIREIYYKPKNFDLLYKPKEARNTQDFRKGYFNPYPGMSYKSFDRSGIDDCIPSKESCQLTNVGHIHNYGDVWARSWNVRESDLSKTTCTASVRLSAMPFFFERTVTLSGSSVFLHYRLLNETVSPQVWMWSLHALAVSTPDARLELPGPGSYIDLKTLKELNEDFSQVSAIPSDRDLHFFSPKAIEDGLAAIHYPGQGLVFRLRWNARILPYLAGSIQTSAYSGERKLSLRPTNGYLENLEKAVEAAKSAALPPDGEVNWDIELSLESRD